MIEKSLLCPNLAKLHFYFRKCIFSFSLKKEKEYRKKMVIEENLDSTIGVYVYFSNIEGHGSLWKAQQNFYALSGVLPRSL